MYLRAAVVTASLLVDDVLDEVEDWLDVENRLRFDVDVVSVVGTIVVVPDGKPFVWLKVEEGVEEFLLFLRGEP